MAERRDKRFITFKEQEHLDYLKDAFNSILVVSCFMFITIPLFEVYPRNILKGFEADWAVCIRIFAEVLYPSVGVFLPFLIFSILKNKNSGRPFRTKDSSATPLHYILGIIIASGIAVSLNAFGSALTNMLRRHGFTVNEALPLTGSSPLTYTVFLICATLIPPFFQELAFRGIAVEKVRKDSYFFAIAISGLLNGFCYRSFTQIPYCFVLGLLLGWLYIKTDSLVLTYTVNASTHFIMALLWTMRIDDRYLFDSIYRNIVIIAIISVFVGLILLFTISGIKIPRAEKDGQGLKGGEAAKAFFKSFALWFFLLFAVFFIMIGKTGKPYIHKEDEKNKAAITEEQDAPNKSPAETDTETEKPSSDIDGEKVKESSETGKANGQESSETGKANGQESSETGKENGQEPSDITE